MWQRFRRLFGFGKRDTRDARAGQGNAPGRAPDTTPHASPSSAPAAPAVPTSVSPERSELPVAPPLQTPLAPVPDLPATPYVEPDDALDDADEESDVDDDDADEDESDAEMDFDEDEAEDRARRSEGDRAVFGEELWGVSARQRAAVLDAARAARFDLPPLGAERELADWLGIPLTRLRWYTHDRPADTTWHYVRYVAPKRSGGERIILAPKRELKALQRKVLDGIVARVPTAATTHGFVRGRSVVTNAQPHVGKQVVLKLDLKDFFPSITFPRVRGLFVALGYPFPVAAALALLCTEYDREVFERDGTRYFVSDGPRHLVQGAPTSPALANLVAWRLDRRLGGLAARRGFAYTRYADDLTFSGDDIGAVHDVRRLAQRIIRDERFTTNYAKTRVARRSARQIVTGLVVNDQIATPRELRRRLRATLHNAEKTGLAAQNRDGRADFAGYLQGLIAFVNVAHPRHALWLRAGLRRALAGDSGAGGRVDAPPAE
jgi:RNA-directed DNA polymerase